MTLAPGSRLGSYQILATLGSGGMGDVYRARDTRLHREVAIKVLPSEFAADHERRARFEHEARTLASLNHPHIAQLHGLEEVSESAALALVMELVDGEDLAARIARGPLAIEEAVTIARQIGAALDAAHMSGVVHRDLKPANVRVRSDGAVKVLDFGLAKAHAAGPGLSPAITSPAMTDAGMILGTAAYMSPEQARGKVVDKRTDIWAFGCVLYEMLTGRAPFEGETVTDVLGSILKTEPDWSQLPPETPPRVKRLLQRCLQKDANARLRDIGDAVADLEGTTGDAPPVSNPRPHRGAALGAGAIVAMIVGIAGAALGYVLRPPPEAPVQKFNVSIQKTGAATRLPVISPDARRIAFVSGSRISVQALDEWKPRELAGTEGAGRLFWSPDGEWIGYFRSETLLKVPANGGPVVRVATLPAVQSPLAANSGAWGEDGVITLSLGDGALMRVPAAGGSPVVAFNELGDDIDDLHDIELAPNGVLLVTVHRKGRSVPDAIGIVEGNALKIVLESAGAKHPSYAPTGHLIFERTTTPRAIWAVPFSLPRGEVTGEPFLVEEGQEPSLARDGTLAFVAEGDVLPRRMALIDLEGRITTRIADAREWTEGFAVSPDGRRLLAAAADGIWVYEMDTGARSRVTTSPDIQTHWVNDNTILFVRIESSVPIAQSAQTLGGGAPGVMMKSLAPGGGEQLLARPARFPSSTADGRRIVFNTSQEAFSPWEVAWIDLDRPATIHRLGNEHVGARFPSVSPDGTLVAYVSGEVGRDEIFLTQLPGGEGKWQLSSEGGGWVRFLPRGNAVVYRAPSGAMMLVEISGGANLKISPPRKLFDWGGAWTPFFAATPDGKHLLAATPEDNVLQVPSVSIVQNWHKQFPRR